MQTVSPPSPRHKGGVGYNPFPFSESAGRAPVNLRGRDRRRAVSMARAFAADVSILSDNGLVILVDVADLLELPDVLDTASAALCQRLGLNPDAA